MNSLTLLLDYHYVLIQCHDNPDSDALASAFAIHRFLSEHGISSDIIYGGNAAISKPNLKLMCDLLHIKAHYFSDPAEWSKKDLPGSLLLTVDGQYGTGNMHRIPFTSIAVLDHHTAENTGTNTVFEDIRPFLGSCSTMIWIFLKELAFPFHSFLDVCTGLYYGLYMDTNSFSEVAHPYDMDMRDSLSYNTIHLRRLKNSNLTMNDLSIAGRTLINSVYDRKTRSAIFEAETCDPNILGFTSDLALQVDNIDCCIVFCRIEGGIKLSVRSCSREVMANELASRICCGIGSGGGHHEKAGGFIRQDAQGLSNCSPMRFLSRRLNDYFKGYDLLYSDDFNPEYTEYRKYKKKPLPIGYVRTTDLYADGTEVIVRTLEGDSSFTAGSEVYIMVGMLQEVYPITKQLFESSYITLNGEYRPHVAILHENRYTPTIMDRTFREPKSILPFIKPCIPSENAIVYAKKLDRLTKIFSDWYPDGYMFGDRDDYFVFRAGCPEDIYVIEKGVFQYTYRLAEEEGDEDTDLSPEAAMVIEAEMKSEAETTL